jgi:hypothetical protein
MLAQLSHALQQLQHNQARLSKGSTLHSGWGVTEHALQQLLITFE